MNYEFGLEMQRQAQAEKDRAEKNRRIDPNKIAELRFNRKNQPEAMLEAGGEKENADPLPKRVEKPYLSQADRAAEIRAQKSAGASKDRSPDSEKK